VGIIIGILDATPIARDFSAVIASLVESNLLLALLGIMSVSLLLGMGVPSVVCYLLVATLMGDILNGLGVDPLAAHMFIFYFGMMSMVTPPVALAAYASASIAEAPIMRTAFASFRFSLVGFTLPFMFIYRPALLLMGENGNALDWIDVATATTSAMFGVVALSAAVTGYLRSNLNAGYRALLFLSALLLLAPNLGGPTIGLIINSVGAILLAMIAVLNKPN
ncbi:MAG: TRAP transporter large permease subunit, partial [Planctomycetota bacterium]